jgi:cytosine/adenosine deaminase-related metal-dependent hydrolase
VRTLLRGGTVLTLGVRTPNLVTGDVLIEDDRIVEVGTGLRARDAEVVDATDRVVLPGFVDAHRSAWRSLMKAVDDRPGTSHLVDLGARHGPDDVYAATLLGLLAALESGVTTVVDWSDILLERSYADAALQAHADAGLRTVFVPSRPAWASDADTDTWRTLAGDLAAAPPPLTGLACGSPALHPDTIGAVATAWAQARSLGLRIHAPVGTADEDRGALAAVGARGLLGADVTLVHATRCAESDLDALGSSDASLVLAPSYAMAAGLGTPPLQALLDRRIRPGLGTGDEMPAPGDVFTAMRAIQSLQHAAMFDLKLAGKAGLPDLLGTRDVIRFATIDGARAAGLDAVTGSIEPGKQADLVVLRTDLPNIHPVNDPIGAVVWGMDASNVDWVFVAGRARVRAGELDAEIPMVRELAGAAMRRLTDGGADTLVPAADGRAR